MCSCDEYDDDHPIHNPKVIGFAIVVASAFIITTFVIAVVDFNKIQDYEESYGDVPIHSKARIIPQLFDGNASRVSSSDIRVNDDPDFRIGYCRENPNDGMGEIMALVQMDVAPGGFPPGGLEFRFDVPMIESTIQESSVLRRCPRPKCSVYNYRDGIGTGREFYNTFAVFLTNSQITQSRTKILPYPISCGCSGEDPIRFSCTIVVPPNVDSTIYGGIAISLHFVYPVQTFALEV